ncbi:hypothetical protein HGRIS_009371 [Hohenbuehelia grisea]|uniref:Uncharacterized protein n=1 Tax=Hohenbuehelia grisea TaxID=104357 RepID=A0ABR3J127_9AGAR
MSANQRSTIPPGYTFFDSKTFMSVEGKEILLGMLHKAEDRSPDAHDMYIYNDFAAYGSLDLVDKALIAIHNKLVKKMWDDAYHLMEALTVFNNCDVDWPTCDDGDRVRITHKAYGALFVTLLRGLKNAGRLQTSNGYASLETMLRLGAEWGDFMRGIDCKSDYDKVCQAIGKRLFADKKGGDIALEEARVAEWKKSLSEEARKDLEAQENDDDEEESEPWFSGIGDYSEDAKSSDFELARVWKKYKTCVSDSPNVPLRGPPKWDLSSWTASDKKPFLFSTRQDDFV